ncbi:hypothetical protein BA895_22365 [Humibacillus sp. DSM 29435]|uniref:DoxX family protein n=1 Tax=Humibacillus sp. DSM 29435 TaxID=1869167 RepID=UPI0008734024|nr:DoxX family protein [Humibacillus sp. DSM 29435]OFE15601.1 hypothetical protein BA895_22365 [Humibacillus sp. DSM 29435]
MNSALWILTSLLGIAFLAGALGQILMPKEKYRSLGASQHWVDDFSAGHIKAIGTIKLAGVTGLILPGVTGVATGLVPLAAAGLMLFMAGAGTTRFRRSEWKLMLGDMTFLLLFAVVAWGRFSLEPLG